MSFERCRLIRIGRIFCGIVRRGRWVVFFLSSPSFFLPAPLPFLNFFSLPIFPFSELTTTLSFTDRTSRLWRNTNLQQGIHGQLAAPPTSRSCRRSGGMYRVELKVGVPYRSRKPGSSFFFFLALFIYSLSPLLALPTPSSTLPRDKRQC